MYEPWAGSELSVAGAVDNGGAVMASPDLSVVIFLFVTALLLLVLFSRFALALSASATVTMRTNQAKTVMQDNFAMDSILISFLLVIPFFVLAFMEDGAGGTDYWISLAVVAAFFAFRRLAFIVFRWLSGNRDCTNYLEKFSLSVWFIVMTVSCLIVAVVFLLHLEKGAPFVRIPVGLLAASGLILYAVKGYRSIISSGFSGFFWFLYLCIFEVLPLCVAVKVVVW